MFRLLGLVLQKPSLLEEASAQVQVFVSISRPKFLQESLTAEATADEK